MKNLKSELDIGLLHPRKDMPNFVGNEDDMGMSLKHNRDFLNTWLLSPRTVRTCIYKIM